MLDLIKYSPLVILLSYILYICEKQFKIGL
jgi:hypothetical protein